MTKEEIKECVELASLVGKLNAMRRNGIEKNIKNYLSCIGANESNKERVDIWLLNKKGDDLEAKAQDLWLSPCGEIHVSIDWYNGYAEPRYFKEVPLRWCREILWELVICRYITKLI